MVLYHDIFRHPLRLDELVYLCGKPDEVARGLAYAVAQNWVQTGGNWVFRPGRDADCAPRRERSACAERTWPRARRAAGLLARLPFVRGVLITGSLSKQSADPGSDIDFLLLVEPGRVWTVKLALQGFRRGMPELVRESLCTNYILSTDNLAIPRRNLYTAVELATAIPMHGPGACVALLQANVWANAFVPGYSASQSRAEWAAELPKSRLRTSAETAIPPQVEARAQSFVTSFWDRRYFWLSETDRQRRFQRGPGVATNHLHDFSGYVESEYASRMAELGVPRP